MAIENQNSDDAKKLPFKVTIIGAWCKKCGICVATCPKVVLISDEFGLPLVKFPEKCIGCMLCVIRCPDLAIDVEKLLKDRKEMPDKSQKDKGE